MKGFIRLMILGAMIGSLLSCATPQTDEDSLTTESYNGSGDATADSGSGASSSAGTDEFADFDNNASGGDAAAAPAQQAEAVPADSAPQANAPAQGQDADLALENEINQAGDAATAKQFAQDDLDGQVNKELAPAAPAAPPEQKQQVAQEPPPPTIEESVAPVGEITPVTEAPAPVVHSGERPVDITGLKYKANDSGGTIIVESSAPVTFTTRANPDLKQYIIEIQNSNLPSKLKRTLNTRDIKGAVGAVDAYQAPGSKTSRIVVQMRDGFTEPAVQQEGNSLLIVTSNVGGAAETVAEAHSLDETPAAGSSGGGSNDPSMMAEAGNSDLNVELNSSKILASQSLDEFLSGNTKFYGKKISIETSNIDVRDALKFITEESGVNMVITDEVKGNISLKLRQVPWDQALVVIMKARRLGYSRQGSVLRIVPIDDLKKEEDDATKLALAKKSVEPLKIRSFTISYAKVDELDKKIKEFLTERGKVISDQRTNTIVVTDIEDSLNRVAKLVQGLDSTPPQVLIEGKIVEASDSFSRSVGINWGFNGADTKITTGKNGPVNLRPSLDAGNNLATSNTGGMAFGIAMGTMDFLGDLTATLALYEKDEKVKVLSAPRVVTLSNEKADISQTNELPVKTTTIQAGQAPTVTYQFKPLTLKLEVTPVITNEGTVIMKVSVNRQIKGAAVSTTDDTFSVNSREANTRVIVKNGQTAVIGGIYRSDVIEGSYGVPWLKDVPVIGNLFKATTMDKQRSELLIFLTPRILAQAESAGPGQSKMGLGD